MTYEFNNIYCEDSYNAIKNIPDKCIDLIITDPPYLIENTTAGGANDFSANGKKSIQNMNDELEEYGITSSIDISILQEFRKYHNSKK